MEDDNGARVVRRLFARGLFVLHEDPGNGQVGVNGAQAANPLDGDVLDADGIDVFFRNSRVARGENFGRLNLGERGHLGGVEIPYRGTGGRQHQRQPAKTG